MNQIFCAGEALIDLVAQPNGRLIPCIGGAAYNLSRALSLQGAPTAYLNPISSDHFGQSLRDGLTAAGTQILETEPVPQPTSLAIVNLDETGQPNYSFY